MRFQARALAGSILLIGLALSPMLLAHAAGVLVVTQSGRAFSATSATISRGDVVRFHNADEFLHQVMVHGPNIDFESDEQAPGSSADVRFPTAGVFAVRCAIHPKMSLTVTVR